MGEELHNAFKQVTQKLHIEFMIYKAQLDMLSKEMDNGKTYENKKALVEENNKESNINDEYYKDKERLSNSKGKRILKPLEYSLSQGNINDKRVQSATPYNLKSKEYNYHNNYQLTENNNAKKVTPILVDMSMNKKRNLYEEGWELYQNKIYDRNNRYITELSQEKPLLKMPSPLKITNLPSIKLPMSTQMYSIPQQTLSRTYPPLIPNIKKKKSITRNPYARKSYELGDSSLRFNPIVYGSKYDLIYNKR